MTEFKMAQVNGMRWIQVGKNVYVDQDETLVLTPYQQIPFFVVPMIQVPE